MDKQTIGLKCYDTILRCVTIFYENRIDKHEYSAVYKDFNEVLPSDYWFPY